MSSYPETITPRDTWLVVAEGVEIPGLKCQEVDGKWTISVNDAFEIEASSKDEIERWGWLIGKLLATQAPALFTDKEEHRPNWTHLRPHTRKVMRLPKAPESEADGDDSAARCALCIAEGTDGRPKCMGHP